MQKYAALTFDDGLISQYQKIYPILNRNNIRATFYVTRSNIGKKGYMGWPEIVHLSKLGHEIGDHYANHIKMTMDHSKKIRHNIHSYLQDTTKLGIPTRSFCYPKYIRNQEIKNIIKQFNFQYARGGFQNARTKTYKYGGVGSGFDRIWHDRHDIPVSCVFGKHYNAKHFKTDFSKLSSNDLILCFHEFDDIKHGNSVPLYHFKKIIRILINDGYKILPMTKMLNIVRTNQKRCILVLAGARTGSSCLSGCLKMCGASIGASPTTHKSNKNTKGFFENKRLYNINRKVLTQLNVQWQNGTRCTIKSNQELRRALVTEFANDDIFVIKDLRLLQLFDLYMQTLHNLGCAIKTIRLQRNVESSARSLSRMKGYSYQDSLIIAKKYDKLANDIAQEANAIHLNFRDLKEKPAESLRPICNSAGLILNKKVRTFVDPSLVHFT